MGFPVIAHQAIVEMKYRRDAPALFRQAVERFKLTPAAISKYRLGFDALESVSAAASDGTQES
jgi:hypothetical protein